MELPGEVGLRQEVVGWGEVRLRRGGRSSMTGHEQRQLGDERLHSADGGAGGGWQGGSGPQVGHFALK